MEQNNTSKIISKIRKSKGLTQQEFGDLIGVSSKTVSKWECGIGLPDVSSLTRISEILDITVDELLSGETKNNRISGKFKIKIISLMSLFIIFVLIILLFKRRQPIVLEENLIDKCTVIRTYYVDDISDSNDENYSYVTIHEFQVEGKFTLKMPKIVAKNLDNNKNYEFTFKTTKEYTDTTTDLLFDNSEIINLSETNKVGLEQVNKSYCSDNN